MKNSLLWGLGACLLLIGCSSSDESASSEVDASTPSASMACGPSGALYSCHHYRYEKITHCYDQAFLTEGMNLDACDAYFGKLVKSCTCSRDQSLGGCSRLAYDWDRDEYIPVVDWYYEGEDYGGMTLDDMQKNCEHYCGVWLGPQDPIHFQPVPQDAGTFTDYCPQAGTASESMGLDFQYEKIGPNSRRP